MNYIIITGTSKGLGESIAKNLIKPNNHLFCISRSKNVELIEYARSQNILLDYFQHDLNDIDDIENLIENIFLKVDNKNAISIVLINNAGILNPIKPIDRCDSNEIIANINTNLIAPMLLTSFFIKKTNDFKIDKRIINISSGAGNKPYYGWSNYCASKAGINIFSSCINLEQKNQQYPTKIISVDPGIIDTNMQAEIRKTKKEYFKDVERFIVYKQSNQLESPNCVAKRILKLLDEK